MSEPTLVQHLLERTNAPTFLVSLPRGEILAANQTACELLQPEASTLGSTRFTEAFEFPEDCPFKAYFEQAPPGPDKACAVLFKSDGNGRKVAINAALQRVAFEEKSCALISCMATPQHQTPAPGNLADLFVSLFDNCPVPLVHNTAEGVNIRINKAFADLCGHSPEEVVGYSALELGLWHNLEERQKARELLKSQGKIENFEAALQKKDGTPMLCEVSTQSIDRDGQQILINVIRDITQRKKTEQALQSSEALFREFFQCNPVPTIISSPEGTIHMANPAFCIEAGYQEEEIVGRTSQEIGFFRNPKDRERMVKAIQETGRLDNMEAQFYNRRKQQRTCTISSRAIQHQGELRILTIVLDITEKKKAEEALIKLDKAKSDFITTAAHELRTPLIAILGYAELLENETDYRFSEEQRQAYASIICRNAEMLDRLVDDLLDMEKIQLGQVLEIHREECALEELIQKAVAAITPKNPDHRFIITHADKLPKKLWVDGGRITQVLHNLLGNAVKYSSTGGTVEVSTSLTEEQVTIAVRDDGIGMTDEQAVQIFDRFYRANPSDTRATGMGLGMSIVKQIIEDHGGGISVDSLPGKGTTVTFTLPVGKKSESEPSRC